MRFTHLKTENWRNFSKVEVPLSQRVFLVGPNASGKSNLLDIFRFLRDLALPAGGGLQQALAERGGLPAIRCLAARQQPDVSLTVQIGNGEEDKTWTYDLKLGMDERGKTPRVQRERVLNGKTVILDRPDTEDKKDPKRRTQTYLEQVNVNFNFRAIAEFFADVRYLHIVPQLVRDPERVKMVEHDPYGSDFLRRVARTAPKKRDARLRRIAEALKVALPQLQNLTLWKDPDGKPHLRGKYEHWRPQGAWQSEVRFSDGTLRLLGLLWALLDGTGPLLLEEPELSLHPGVVRHLPQMFARIQNRTGRQVILSTHSSDLLSDPGIGLDEVLLLLPEGEGSVVRVAGDLEEVKELLDAGHTMAEAILPRTEPSRAVQLTLFKVPP